MRRFGRLSIVLNVFVLLLVGVIIGGSLARWYFERDGKNQEALVVEVPQGAGLDAVTNKLEERGLIDSPLFFKLSAYALGNESRFKFGEYEIPARASIREIQDILTEGRAIQLLVTFPEGWTSYKMVDRLKAVPELTGEISEVPPEGTLAPNTYAFMRGETRQAVLDRMIAEQEKNLMQAWENRADDLPISSPEELLILASIVEKETGVPEERPIVASVFVNRLRQGIRLQTDPTVIYGITLGKEELGRGLRRSELVADTPYNTYVIDGLPPTPIANPGLKSLQAAANPAETEFVYFVADGTGGHAFAKTLEEHNANVQKWRAIEAQNN